jgi:hypothetical protein
MTSFLPVFLAMWIYLVYAINIVYFFREKEESMKRRHIDILLTVAGLLVFLSACGALAPEGYKRVQFRIEGCG